MSATKPGTVKETGAAAGAVLIGRDPANRGLLIRVHNEQTPGRGGRIEGPFDLLDAGSGDYARQLARFNGCSFATAKDLIEQVSS